MSTFLLVATYGMLIVASSIGGGYLPTMFRLTHLRLQVLLSLVGGFMLGVALLHLLPHAVAISDSVPIYGSLDFAVVFVLIGLLLTFFLMRVFHFHQHGPQEQGDVSLKSSVSSTTGDGIEARPADLATGQPSAAQFQLEAAGEETAEHRDSPAADEHHGHSHDLAAATASSSWPRKRTEAASKSAVSTPCDGHGASHAAHRAPADRDPPGGSGATNRRFNWMGVAFGLGLHTFVDGVALGAAIVADEKHEPSGFFLKGFGVFLAIFLHKPLDAISICSLMRLGNWSEKTIQSTNVLLALLCPAGAMLVALGVGQWSMLNTVGAGVALVVLLAMSAGVFLCISLSDLLPELQFHRHHRLQLSAALLFGLLAAYGIKFVEPAHSHPSASATYVPRDEHEHHFFD